MDLGLVSVLTALCFFGFISNLVSLRTWTELQKRAYTYGNLSTAILFISIDVSNIGVLMTFLSNVTIPTFWGGWRESANYALFYSWMAYPGSNFFWIATQLSLLSLLSNRCIMVFFPRKYVRIYTKKFFLTTAMAPFLLAFLAILPTFLVYNLGQDHARLSEEALVLAWFGRTQFYHYYKPLVLWIVSTIFPWTCAAASNFLVYTKVRRHNQQNPLIKIARFATINRVVREERRMSKMLFPVMAISLLLTSFRLIREGVVSVGGQTSDLLDSLTYLGCVTNAMSQHFVCYFFSRDYRHVVRRLFRLQQKLVEKETVFWLRYRYFENLDNGKRMEGMWRRYFGIKTHKIQPYVSDKEHGVHSDETC